MVADEGVLGEESTPRAVVQGGGLDRRVQAPEALALALSLLVDPVAHVALHAGRLEDGLVPVHRVRPGRKPILVIEAGIACEEDDRVVPSPKRGERQGEVLDIVPVEGLVVRSHLIIVQGSRVHLPLPRQSGGSEENQQQREKAHERSRGRSWQRFGTDTPPSTFLARCPPSPRGFGRESLASITRF